MDLVCFDDVDNFAAEYNDPVAELEQDLYHRLLEPRGSNIDDPDRGLGLEDALSGVLDPNLKNRIEAELRKDDRVIAAVATITALDATGARYRIDIDIQPSGEIVLLLDGQGVRRVV